MPRPAAFPVRRFSSRNLRIRRAPLRPVLDFFETCPIQTITLEVGLPGSQQTGQTTFVTSKGSTTQTATAILTDVMGNSSLAQHQRRNRTQQNPFDLERIATRRRRRYAARVLQSCSLNTPLPGSGSVTASCSPPTCNIGYPFVPASLSTPAAITTCTQFFHAQSPQFVSCQQLIPSPVYASPTPVNSGSPVGDGASLASLPALRPRQSVATSTGCVQPASLHVHHRHLQPFDGQSLAGTGKSSALAAQFPALRSSRRQGVYGKRLRSRADQSCQFRH